MDTIIQFNNVSFSYHQPESEIKAISNISFQVKRGEFVSIVGPSGCGKSTILSILAGLLKKETGEIEISPSIRFGYMFQQDLLLPYYNIWKNVTLGPAIHHNLSDSTANYIKDLLIKYGLSDFQNKFPSQLSGGMRQRAALIRTLAQNPDVLLLDEPFSALDYQTRLIVADDIAKIIRSEEKTAIMVTHDLSEAICLSDKIIVLSKGPASVIDTMHIHIDHRENGSLYIRTTKEFENAFQRLWKEMNPNHE